MYSLLYCSGAAVNIITCAEKDHCDSQMDEILEHSNSGFCGTVIPSNRLLDNIGENCITVDTLIAKTALASTLEEKLDVIAENDFDKLPEHEWERALGILSVYLDMSVCDILGAIADRRPNTPVPDQPFCSSEEDEDCVNAYVSDEDYDYPQPYSDDYYLSDEYQQSINHNNETK